MYHAHSADAMRKIYLDHAASTPVDPEVFAAMEPYLSERFGNPGSLHSFGQAAIAAMDRARETIAKALGAEFQQIVFTGSATEANNLALRGAVRQFRAAADAAPHIVVSAIEHESVLETARDLEKKGVRATYVPVNARGIVDENNVKDSLTPNTALVSVMYANNEIGTIEPIAAIAQAVKGTAAPALFHTDAAQAFQFLDCDAEKLGVDLVTISSHKIYGPKGAAALYVKDPSRIAPIIAGGGQEFGLRSGTENVPAIVGFAKAVELALHARERESKRLAALRDRLWEGIKAAFPDAEMNGGGPRLPNILNVYLPGHPAESLLTKLDLEGLAASSGSACRARAVAPSYVVAALGHPNAAERARCSVRFSLGRPTTEEEIAAAAAIVRAAA